MNRPESPSFALLIIDMINDFDFKYGNMLLAHTKLIVNPILKLKKQMKEKGFPIIYINDHYDLWQADFDKIIDICKNEGNASLIERIKPQQDEFFLIKPKHSAFYGTALNTLLKRLNVDTLIITGIAGNICVLFTANDAYMREYKLWIPKDCIASASKEDNHYALKMMNHVLKASIKQGEDM
ncbi:isochorismatase family cysteine hydrolase [Peribacillus castrilensis]|uniref:Cysteine hydrolase family protein n=1 Tax=Peribacillus simplex TaxID=1478 RepID=A0AAN2PD16_9BACI|nr:MULTISPECIES: isochorismatase family cysteine hydrolase [Bacillaceae]MCP1097250.1 cysteine hydrolase [Bacillaceae bacterium OS4b]MBD8591446.1 cysteine hydrolase [Peribacillus simplex]MCF7620142.1 cysteine hydrolase [Peribacillus frigoritolerans]MCP1150889.1 cysteine hydrolase [Peribacillus frigoritolerans]MCT1391796.1 cysteine hydrolase [Peribacillus frigoritolerans]